MGTADTHARTRDVLVVADEAVVGDEVVNRVRSHIGETGGVRVVAPVLTPSALKHELGDVDESIAPARERLEQTLQALRRAGIEAEGTVGDADPLTAISDELQNFRADEVVVVGHEAGDAAYAERGLLDRAGPELEPAIAEVTVGPHRHVVDEQELPARGYGLDSVTKPNLPSILPRDAAGIAVGVLGTAILILLAANSANSGDASPPSGVAAARMLIAMGALLVNLAHVVGLVLFSSVTYRGVWERFLSRATVIGTPVAVLVSLLIG